MLTFNQLITTRHYKLERAALLMAKEIAYKDLNIESCISRLDGMADIVALRLSPNDGVKDILHQINTYLFEEQGFEGNTTHYYDPRNSFLNDVVVRHTGIPITLSILYIAIAERLGLSAFGVGLPGHFIVGCRLDDETALYIDPFHEGLLLSADECALIAREYLPQGSDFNPEHLLPQSNRMILIRMLNNLRQIYLSRRDNERLLGVLRLQSSLNPADIELQRDLGLLAAQNKSWALAVRALRTYCYAQPRAQDYEIMRAQLDNALEHLSKLN